MNKALITSYFNRDDFRPGHIFVWDRAGNLLGTNTKEDNNAVYARLQSALDGRQYKPGDPKRMYAQMISVDPRPPNGPATETFSVKSGANNAPFKKKQLEGKIVVSPLVVFSAKVRYGLGTRVISDARADSYALYLWEQTDIFNVVELPKGRGANIETTPGRFIRAFVTCNRVVREYDQSIHPFDVGWSSDLSRSVASSLVSFDPIKGNMVQEVLAAANTGALDLLTAVAELPETVASIANGIGAVARITEDFKKREFALFDKHLKKKNRFMERLKNLRNSKWKSRKLLRKQERLVLKDLKDLADEFVSETASLWMWYRYEVLPNAYLIEDAINYFRDIIRSFEKYRKRVVEEGIQSFDQILNGWESNSLLTKEFRAWIKRSYSLGVNFADQVLKHMGTSALVTAFELMTRSFVVDWFITVGDFLRAIVFQPTHDQQASSYSQRTSGYSSSSHTATKATVVINVDGYERKIIDPCDYTGIYIDVGYDLVRQLDTFAMLWPVLSKKIKSL